MSLRRYLLLAILALLVAAPADAWCGGRIRMLRAAVGEPGSLPALFTGFGPRTKNGNAGVAVCAEVPGCIAPITLANSPTNWMLDTDGELVPKNGAVSSAYNGARTVGDLTDATLTYTDAAGKVGVIHVDIDAATYGTFTVKDKASRDLIGNDVQFENALYDAAYGESVRWRKNSQFNTPGHAGVLNGTAAYVLNNNGVPPGAFNGENHIVIGPELSCGGPCTVTLGNLRLDSQGLNRLDGLRFEHLNFYGNISSNALLAGAETRYVDVWDSAFRSDEGDWLNQEVARSDAIYADNSSHRWRIRRTSFRHVGAAVSLKNPPGTINAGAATYSDPTNVAHEITDNYVEDASGDVFAISCITGGNISRNFVTDKRTAVVINGLKNPFDKSGAQPHGDYFQMDMTQCGFGRYAATTIEDNYFTRGDARNSMPWWTSPPYATPNTGGNPQTPNPLLGYDDAQGVFRNNSSAGSGWRTSYPAVWVAPKIRGNFYNGVMVNCIFLGDAEDPDVRWNTCIGDYPASASNLQSSPYGGTRIMAQVTGNAGLIQYNVAQVPPAISLGSGAAVSLGSGTGVAGTTNAVVTYAGYSAAFAAPQPSVRTVEAVETGFRAKSGGTLFVNDNQPAGVWCSDGRRRTAAAC